MNQKLIKARKLNSLREKTVGLLGRNEAEPLYFETRWGIHSFGMKFPIDVIILNKQNVVIKLKENLEPNKYFFWNPIYFKVLELPSGDISKNKIKKGEKLFISHLL